MIFSADVGRHKTNPLICIKFWRQARLPSLLFGSELFSLIYSQLNKLGRCQQWFLKNIFYVPRCTPNPFLVRILNLNSRSLLFLGRLIIEQKMSPTVRRLFHTRTDSFFNADLASAACLSSICESLSKYDLLHHFQLWFSESIFPCHEDWKVIVRTKIREKENTIW